MTQDFNVNPYYDDYDQTKGFHRVLYKPGIAVQSRELTQQQTILQNQISRFADHVFADGSKVTGGETFINTKTSYITLTETYSGVAVDVENFLGKIITGATSGASAKVVHVSASDGSDPNTLYIQMLTGDSPTTSAAFSGSEIIQTTDGVAATISSSSYSGYGSLFHINEGVYYIDGFFVYVAPQSLILEKYTSTPSCRVGLSLLEEIITASDDDSLLDPARGAKNFQGVGADRYKISLILDKKSLDYSEDVDNASAEKFIELMRVESGVKQSESKYPIYSELARTMARRTYDESGNYTTRPFRVTVNEHETDDTLLEVSLESGKAYVNGFEFETISNEYLEVSKARETQTEQNREVNAKYGNFCIVSGLNGVFNPTQLISIDLMGVAVSSISNQTDYTNNKIGTANLRFIEHVSGTGNAAIYNFYIFNIEMDSTHSFGDVRSIWKTSYATATYCDIDASGIVSSTAQLYDSDYNSLVFSTPFSSTKTLKPAGNTDTQYNTQRAFTGVSFTGGTASINVGGDLTFFGGSGALSGTIKDRHYLCILTAVSNAGSTGLTVGDLVSFNGSSRTITLSGGGQTASFDANDAAFAATATIIATINTNLKSEKTKTLTSTTVSGVALSGNVGDLEISDVYRIVEIRDTGNSDAVVTSSFNLDTGQKDSFYDHGSIILKSGESVTGPFDVDIEYFTHSGSGYFSVDSYTDLDYEDIPEYTSTRYGTTVNLRDVIDFRPRRTDGAATFDADSSGIDIAKPYENVDFDGEFYLPRIDRLVLKADLNFAVLSGTPSLSPIPPKVAEGDMLLYNLYVPAYTFAASDVYTEYVDNRGYTMADIGAIARRIDRLEYYTSLSLLEKHTSDLTITDGSGNDLFKNGIFVDPFSDHSLGDYTNEDYLCMVDSDREEMRPRADRNFFSFEYTSSGSSNVTKTNDGITVQYDEVAAITQPLASDTISLNPFSVAVWQGQVKLYPQTDQWVDIETTPSSSVGSTGVETWADYISSTGAKTTLTSYSMRKGKQTTTNYALGGAIFASDISAGALSRSSYTVQHGLATIRIGNPYAGRYYKINGGGTSNLSGAITGAQSTVNTYLYNQIMELAKSQGEDSVTGMSVIPYIRAQDINFEVYGLKPNTRFYAYFDDTDVTEYITPDGGSLGDALYSDDSGYVLGTFSLPNSDDLRFLTGTRMFKLTDSVANNDDNATSIAESQFYANGMTQTQTSSTRPNQIIRAAPADNTVVSDPVSREISGRSQSTITYRDPVAQIFTIDKDTFANGVFLSSIELYFSSKDDTLPVSIELRPTVNGYPSSSEVIVFSQVTLNPSDVLISDDASVSTKFVFDVPCYLQSGEYAIVISANSEDYRIFVATLGGTVIGSNNRITSQPNSGALFKSQNASTWQAVLDQDIAFKVNRCDFDTAVTGTAIFDVEIPSVDYLYDAFSVLNDIVLPPKCSYQLSYKKRDESSGNFDTDWTNFDAENIVELASRAILDFDVGSTSLKIRAIMSTTDSTVSPMIDEERTNVITFKNSVNNDSTDEDAESGGAALAKYITRKINLEEGFDATGVKVYINAYLPSGTDIKVYARVQAAEDPTTFTDLPFVELTRTGFDTDTSSGNNYIELEFDELDLSYDGYTDIRSFQIKAVMLSSSTTKVPTMRDLRAIAVS